MCDLRQRAIDIIVWWGQGCPCRPEPERGDWTDGERERNVQRRRWARSQYFRKLMRPEGYDRDQAVVWRLCPMEGKRAP